MKQQTKFSKEQQETQAAETRARPSAAREFVNADELLRFDAEQTMVPPEIARRLQQSADQTPPAPQAAWWKRFF